MNFAISTYSQHPDETFDAAMCLRNEKNALAAAIDAGDAGADRRSSTGRSASRRTR